MGCCSSHNQSPKYEDAPTSMSDLETSNLLQPDYRSYTIKAYVHSILILLQNEYNNSEYKLLFTQIPIAINRIIESYYIHYHIFSAEIKQLNVRQLPELEYLVFDTKNVFHGDKKIYIKDFRNRMHAFIQVDTMNDNQSGLMETYCFSDFMHINEIEIIKHSLYDEYRKIIKLKNGSIYSQYSKNRNGWNQIYQFKLKRVNIISIDCGFEHCLFLTLNGLVYSEGRNDEGQCGIIKTKNGVRVNDSYISSPTLINTFIQNQCNIQSISCGHGHNVCIEAKGNNVWMFGRNNVWQCSPESNSNFVDQGIHGYYARYRTEIYLPRRNESFIDTNIIKAKCGNDFTVLLSAKGFLYGLGNINGEINLEIKGVSLLSKKNNIIEFECGSDYIVWITNKNKIYSFESKQSWWYGWNRNRSFTQDWNSSKAIYWKYTMFNNNIINPQQIHKILVGKNKFVLFIN